jgi:hypothetical protein
MIIFPFQRMRMLDETGMPGVMDLLAGTISGDAEDPDDQ